MDGVGCEMAAWWAVERQWADGRTAAGKRALWAADGVCGRWLVGDGGRSVVWAGGGRQWAAGKRAGGGEIRAAKCGGNRLNVACEGGFREADGGWRMAGGGSRL